MDGNESTHNCTWFPFAMEVAEAIDKVVLVLGSVGDRDVTAEVPAIQISTSGDGGEALKMPDSKSRSANSL
jgi:hypothetical protein